MKRILLAVCAVFIGWNVIAENRTKEYKKSFPADGVNELTVWNRYGNIDIRQEGNVFEIEAAIVVEAKSQAKVDEMLEYIYISAKEQAGVLNVKTVFEKNMSTRQLLGGISVGVDYRIKVPVGKKVRVISQDGNVTMGDFDGSLSVDIVSGSFKAGSVKGEDFSAKLSKGEFEVKNAETLSGEFKSAKVKIGEGTRMTLDCNATDLQLLEADNVAMKSRKGTCYLGTIENLEMQSFYTKNEIQDIGGSLRMDARWGEVNVRNVHFSFSLVEMKTASTKVGLTFMDGCGYHLELKHNKGMKVDLPESFALIVQPTSEKKTILETGFVGNKKYNGKVVLNMSGGNLFIQ